MPVITMASPSFMQNSMESLSRIEPPGCIKAEIPSAAAI
jgi:hypothetical protein